MPPGVTGLWQVSGRSETGCAERVALEPALAISPSSCAPSSLSAKAANRTVTIRLEIFRRERSVIAELPNFENHRSIGD
jgi:hypothetical protein